MQASADFDGNTYTIQHSAFGTTGCLDVSGGTAADGQDVNTAACDQSDGQKWTFQKRTEGDFKDSYQLVSNAGDDTHCLDNRGVFNGVYGMTISTCLDDTDANADQQSVTVTSVSGGYDITFTEKDTAKAFKLAAYRSVIEPSGDVGQSGVSTFRTAWSLVSSAPVGTPTPTPTPEPTPEPSFDFDGQTLYVWHETDDSEGCLDVKHGNRSNGQDVWTWECNKTDAQKWKFEKRAAGAYAGSYRLVSALGSDTHCLDNRGDFTTGDRMGIWSCVDDTHGAAANQSVTIAASGEGYTLTFVRNSDSKSVWLVTDRTSTNPKGGVNQTTVSGAAPDSAVWTISATAPGDTPAQQPPANNPPANNPPQNNPPANDPPPPPQPQQQNVPVVQDPLDGLTVHLVNASKGTLACVEVSNGGAAASVYTTECDKDAVNQQFVFEKRDSGHFKGTYRINPKARPRGNNPEACLDNVSTFARDFTYWHPVEMHTCVGDEYSNLVRVANQSFTITNVGGGYTISASHNGRTAWMTATRDEGDYGGDVDQITASGEPPASAIWRFTSVFEPPSGGYNFDSQVLEIYHYSDAATGCLTMPEVTYENRSQRRDIQLSVAACNGSAGQKWQFERQPDDKYLLRSVLYNQVRCIDNDGQFQTSNRMRMEFCAVNDNSLSDSDFADQAINIDAELDGYTLTFTSTDGDNSSWLSTNRADDSASGAVGQTTAVDEVPMSAIWGIGIAIDRAAGQTNAPPPIVADPYNGKVFKIKTKHPSTPGYVSGCLHSNVSSRQSGAPLSMASFPSCHWHTLTEYDDRNAGKDWRIEKRTSGAFAGYYRIVSMFGAQTRCVDADVADSIDGGNEYTTTPAFQSGLYLDICVGDSHADVASQSVLITKLPNKGAYGKDTYTIMFTESAENNARQVYLSATYRTVLAGQRALTDTVHENSTLYLEEQVVKMTRAPARFIAPTLGLTPSLDGKKVQIYHLVTNANACLEGKDASSYHGRDVTTATCQPTATDAQTWTLQKRASGRYAGYYQLVNNIGNYCLSYLNSGGTFKHVLRNCFGDDSASADETSYAFEPHGTGYTITSVHYMDGYDWVVTNRTGANTVATISQIDKETGVRANGVWRVTILPDTD